MLKYVEHGIRAICGQLISQRRTTFWTSKTDVGLLATRRAKAKHIYFVRSLRTQSKLSGVEAGG